VLRTLICVKTQDLREQNEVVLARWLIVLRHFWTRGLGENTNDTEGLSIARFRTILDWSSQKDGKWIDREGVGILTYAACSNNTEVLRAVLTEIKGNMELINAQIPKSGFVYVGIPGSCTALIGAMVVGSIQIVNSLLGKGANPFLTDKNGFDPLMCACTYGRLENVKFWLERYTEYELKTESRKFGSTPLLCAIIMGPNRLKLVEYLINKGAEVDVGTYNGTSTLIAACANEDADPRVVQMLLEHSRDVKMINRRMRARTTQWKGIYLMSKLAVRTGLTQSTLMKRFAERQGRTALHYAARRGDLDLVELLLSHGADPSVRDDAGKNVRDLCSGFPELRGMLEKRERMMKLRGTGNKTRAVEVLGKRISTATPIQHEMWLISLETLLMLYGEGSHGHVMEVHQKLRDKFLTPWHSVPADAEIIFVSTQIIAFVPHSNHIQ